MVKEGEVSLPDSDFPSFTWKQLKARLHGWPQTRDGGLMPEEKKGFKDEATLNASGVVGDADKTKRYNLVLLPMMADQADLL